MATSDLDAATRLLGWLQIAQVDSGFGDIGDTTVYYFVVDDNGKDVTSRYHNLSKKVSGGFRSTETKYRLTAANKALEITRLTNLIDSINYKAAIAAKRAAVRLAKYQESIGMGPIRKKGALLYNVSSLSQAYLKSGNPDKASTSDAKSNFDTFSSGYGNSPRLVSQAMELWKNSSNHKGMITTWTQPSGTSQISAQKTSGMGTMGITDPNKYAFQFLYNPQPITMAYKGAPAIDVTQYTSGSEDYALWAGGEGGGTISFDLLLMRMYDMPHYTADKNGKGVLQNKDIYVNRHPRGADNAGSLFDEQDAIYNKGTMYDLEFLLRTVMGITIDSQWRGNTADIGWVGAMPVEIHLGPGLRYWATISGLTVNHVMFNERMVPIFSTVHVEANRLPDYNWTTSAKSVPNASNNKALSAFRRAEHKGKS
jgi:hypothetical protein